MNFNRYYFLYVEDDPLSREVMQMIMENVMDVEHLTLFEDSQNFGQRLANLVEKPDLILIDLHMQPINGFAMLKLIRAHPSYRDTKVIAVTASVMDSEIAQLRSSGFNGAISKPLQLTNFPTLIERILNGESVWTVTDD